VSISIPFLTPRSESFHEAKMKIVCRGLLRNHKSEKKWPILDNRETHTLGVMGILF